MVLDGGAAEPVAAGGRVRKADARRLWRLWWIQCFPEEVGRAVILLAPAQRVHRLHNTAGQTALYHPGADIMSQVGSKASQLFLFQ